MDKDNDKQDTDGTSKATGPESLESSKHPTSIPEDLETSQSNLQASRPGKLRINLHKYQKTFLIETAAKSNIPVDELCELIIDVASCREDAEAQLKGRVSPIILGKTLLKKQRWTSVEIDIHPYKLEALEKLSASPQKSPSRILRYLIEKYLRESQNSASWYQKSLFHVKTPVKSLLHHWKTGAFATFVVVIALGLFLNHRGYHPTLDSPAWAGYLASVVFDPHTHTAFSEGTLSPKELVDLAVANGCEALAITDYSHKKDSAGVEQLEQIRRLRVLYPNLLLLSGIDVNMPKYKGSEQLSILAGPENEAVILRRLGDSAEKIIASSVGTAASDQDLIDLLTENHQAGVPLITIYNHPSRPVPNTNESIEDILKWQREGYLITALEGASAHQVAISNESNSDQGTSINRWGPIVARVGGGWDMLLAQGHNIWGAIASSDYHNGDSEQAPCKSSRTHIAVPEKSYQGILSALKAGTFWAGHGRILDQFKFSVEVKNLDEPAFPGSTVYIGHRKSTGFYKVEIKRGPGNESLPLIAEIIGNCSSGDAEIMAEIAIFPGNQFATGLIPITEVGLDQKSCYVRARVRSVNWEGDDYLAYSNPIRFML